MPDLRSWNEMAEWFDTRQGDAGDRWHSELIYPCVKKMAGNVAGLRTLDLACGNGSLTRWLKRQGALVTGTDATLELLQHARRRESESPQGIEYVHCDAARLEFAATAEFDLVTCTMALMDMPDAESPIREIARVMKPDGRAANLHFPSVLRCPGKRGVDRRDWGRWQDERVEESAQISRNLRRTDRMVE